MSEASITGLNESRPEILQVSSTNNFTLYKITLMNSPEYHVDLLSATNFTAWGVKIIAPYDSPNTDGIDPQQSSNVTITNSCISVGDDDVAVQADDSPGSAYISVTNNHFGDGHGASIGSVTNTGVSNVLFDHISFAGNASNSNQAGAKIKSDISRGGLVQNVTYSDICVQNVRYPIWIYPFYTVNATGNLIPDYQNITLKNVHATTEGKVVIQCLDAAVPTIITLDNVQLDGIKSSDITTEYTNFTLGPDPVNFGALLKGTGITVTNNVSTSSVPYICPASVFSPITGELIPGPSHISAAQSLTVQVQVFPTKAVPYQTYLANLKSNSNATLALPAPTGTVTVYDGATAVATGTLSGGALLSVPINNLSVGSHTLTGTYSGDTNYATITFGSYQVTVDHFPTSTTLTAFPTIPNPWEGVVLSAAVVGSDGVPTGSVTFMTGSATLATVSLDANGHAMNMTAPLIPGSNIGTAVYSGDATYAVSTSQPVFVIVFPAL